MRYSLTPHPRGAWDSEPILERCTVEVHIRRNWAVYFVKNVCMLVFVTYGGLMALMMQADEMMGDRCAWLVVAVLIVVTAHELRKF